jgi:hypothetical protein
MIEGLLILTTTIAIVMLLNKTFRKFAYLSDTKKSYFRRYYFTFLGGFFVCSCVAMGISNNEWRWIELLNIGFGGLTLILSLAFPKKL